MYAYVLFCISDSRYNTEIQAFPEIAKYVLPSVFCPAPDVYRSGDFILFYWHTSNDKHGVRQVINPGMVTDHAKGAFFASGYLAEGMIDRDRSGVFSLIEPNGAGMQLSDTTGGVSANVWISSGGKAAQCWSTQPPAIPTFYAKNRDGFCVVGNRPRLVHAASILGHAHTIDSDYFQKYLVSGFALDGSTPYPETRAVPPNRSLIVRNGSFEVAPYPLGAAAPIPHDQPLDEKSNALAKILESACWPTKAVGRSNLFLSGGKDSRALASALKGSPNISAFTIGDVAKGEGFAAKPVAERLGAAFQVRSQPIISDPLKAAANSNLYTDGLGINFAHQYNFLQDLAFLEGLPSLHGHGHLLRGGFARTMNRDPQWLLENFKTPFTSAFVTQDANAPIGAILDAWLAERSPDFRDSRDILFYSNMDYRLGLFTAPVSIEFTSRAFMVYPLLDERVSRFASSLAVFDRVSERVVFGAKQILAKDLTELPLFGEIWRFDRSPEKRDFVDSDHNFQDGFDLRQPREASKIEDINVNQSAFTYDADRESFRNSTQIAAQFILSSSKSGDVRELLQPNIMAEIESLAKSGANTPAHARRDPNLRFVIGSFISRVFIATTLYDLRW